MPDPGRTRLTSWKEIAAHLRREVRTVIRWEKERGLPVHRLPGGQGRSVFAFTDELDKWEAGEFAKGDGPEADAPATRARVRGPLGIAAGVMLIGAALAAGLAMAGWPHHEIARVVVGDTAIHAVDDDGRPLWSHTLDGRSTPGIRRTSQIVDLTGDGHPDAVATTIVTPTEDTVGTGQLVAVNERGQRLWQRSLDTHLAFGGGSFDAPWLPDDIAAFTNGGEPFVAWAVHHMTWWPSMLAVFDARGSRVGTFVNAGWIRRVRPSADGRHIIAAGFSNSRKGAAFAVLDARRPDGSSPEEPGSHFECRNCPPGRPLHYFVVDWSDVASPLPPDERDVEVTVHPGNGAITLHALQRRHVEVIVDLAADFKLKGRAVNDSFWNWHQRLEHNGTLTHARDRCPHRDGPIVREWTPDRGWIVHY